MKKTYEKPQMFFEDFRLSYNIANCAPTSEFGEATSATRDSCGFEFYGVGTVFSDMSSCEFSTQDCDWNSLCYHGYNAGALFAS